MKTMQIARKPTNLIFFILNQELKRVWYYVCMAKNNAMASFQKINIRMTGFLPQDYFMI